MISSTGSWSSGVRKARLEGVWGVREMRKRLLGGLFGVGRQERRRIQVQGPSGKHKARGQGSQSAIWSSIKSQSSFIAAKSGEQACAGRQPLREAWKPGALEARPTRLTVRQMGR